MVSTLISGGTIINAESTVVSDLLIEDGKVAALYIPGRGTADHVIDATGKYVLPGGIDVHTHFEYPVLDFSTHTADDFVDGTTSAAFGGTTTIVDFVKTPPGERVRDCYRRRRDAVADKAIIDAGLHVIVPPLAQQEGLYDDLQSLVTEGATSWKFFMAYPSQMVDDSELLQGFELASDSGALPMVHAENGHMVARDTNNLIESGDTGERFHSQAHTHRSEAEAVNRAALLAESVGAPLYVVHISSAEAAARLEQLRVDGGLVFGETCPQYLALAYEEFADRGPEAAGWLCSPPIRERSNQKELWKRLDAGILSVVATDHAGFCLREADDLPPQKLKSPGFFPNVPNGVPGVGDRMMVLWETGVVNGWITPNQFVDVTATQPAKLFGMFPDKGVIAAGADADIVIWDPQTSHTITAASSHTRTDYNLYEGKHVTGKPEKVFSRGDLIVDNDILHASPGRGNFLVRNSPRQI